MHEIDIHKCLISYGFYPMTLVLKELEKEEKYEECDTIFNAMTSFKEKFKIVEYNTPTSWSKDFEKEYLSYFKKTDKNL